MSSQGVRNRHENRPGRSESRTGAQDPKETPVAAEVGAPCPVPAAGSAGWEREEGFVRRGLGKMRGTARRAPDPEPGQAGRQTGGRNSAGGRAPSTQDSGESGGRQPQLDRLAGRGNGPEGRGWAGVCIRPGGSGAPACTRLGGE
ncbi:hypothetical protein P7K49_026156 [Saguinus oedipus]|uniref:Uncharacterized protein n=1 Tax=Saguinus oedipus TaxID=9490 RepID=A0ABQ9UJ71_SAGOE|nr:hypothetical protein P7K49_026156 [Saguinus oedipus]